jgi:Ni/Fe-hydrogenase subunit HybB-like protein
MKTVTKEFLTFLNRCARLAVTGDWRYHLWLGVLAVVCLLGVNAYCKQIVHGLVVTGMTDQVSWGVYIANFTFLVGVAAAAVMLVIPAYLYENEDLHDLVIFGELLAISAILMCLVFVTVDLGRPDRFWHMIPGIGKLNFPGSMLSWDVVVLNGYLILNIYLCAYLLFCRYRKKMPSKWLYVPVVFLGIVWAILIHTVTAFLYVGLGGKPFWNSAIVGPRFIASAFTAGPALIILAMQVIRWVSGSPLVKTAGPGHGPRHSRPAEMTDFDALASLLPELDYVTKSVINDCLTGATVLELKKGDVLLRQGEESDCAYFVLEGSVEIIREDRGRSRIIRTVGPGELVGEISVLMEMKRTASASAEHDGLVLRLDASSLRTLLQNHELNTVVRSRMSERLRITDRALFTLRSIIQVSMIINVFLLLNEVFTEFYTDSLHGASATYLYLGLHGYNALVPWIWTAVACNSVALILFILPISRSLKWLSFACVLAIVGIWIEKGMGLVVPGFVPTPLGEIVEYSPTVNETLISFGIWAFGIFCYTIMLRVAVPVLQGRLTLKSRVSKVGDTTPVAEPVK